MTSPTGTIRIAAVSLLIAGLLGCAPRSPESASSPAATEIDRRELGAGLAHRRFELRTGAGELDLVHVHRVVREDAAGRPAPDGPAVLLLPGFPNYFEAVFLPTSISEAIPRDHALASYLAARGVDVWGMDYGWALLSAEATDLEPLRDWGVERDARDAARAVAFARAIRRGEERDDRTLTLVGFSYGGIVSYAVASAETARPPAAHDVGGLVALDIGLALPPEPLGAYYCSVAEADRAKLAEGVLSDDVGLFTRALADRAISAPDAPSPDFEGLSNLEAALVFGASTWRLNQQPWQFVGGELDERGIPSGLRFTDVRLWLDLLRSIPPHGPMRVSLEVDEALCGRSEPPFAAGLGRIELPILQIAAAGGLGTAIEATGRRTASDSVTDRLVRRLGVGEERTDFGHADLLLARDAPDLVWQPLLDWLLAQR